MKLITHAICSAIVSAFIPNAFPYLVVSGVAPDIIDYIFKLHHRNKLTHNIATVMLLAAASVYIPSMLYVSLGFLHHLILDIFTVQGIYIFNKRFSISKRRSNDPIPNSAMLMVHFLFLTLNL